MDILVKLWATTTIFALCSLLISETLWQKTKIRKVLAVVTVTLVTIGVVSGVILALILIWSSNEGS